MTSFSATIEQLSLDDLFASADEAKQDGMKRAEEKADSAWKERALSVIETICRRQQYFNSDDVEAELVLYPERTHDTRALGPLMIKAAKLGYCRATDRFSKTTSKRAHARPIRTWESLLL